MLRGAPKVFPGLAAFIDPHGSVATTTDAFGALYKVLRDKSRELQQATGFGLTEHLLELLDVDSRLELIFVNTDDTPHARTPPDNLLRSCRPSRPVGLTLSILNCLNSCFPSRRRGQSEGEGPIGTGPVGGYAPSASCVSVPVSGGSKTLMTWTSVIALT